MFISNAGVGTHGRVGIGILIWRVYLAQRVQLFYEGVSVGNGSLSDSQVFCMCW